MSRRRAASAAISVAGANKLLTSVQSTKRYVERRPRTPRRVRRTLETSQPDSRAPTVGRRATSLMVSAFRRLSMMSRPSMCSPWRGLKGFRSTSQLRRRAPSVSRDKIRLAFTKMRRRWLVATKPVTRGASPLRPGTTTMSSIRPIAAPPASRRGKRMIRNA